MKNLIDTTTPLATAGYPPPPDDPIEAVYYAIRLMPELRFDDGSEHGKLMTDLGIIPIDTDPDRYDAQYGPGASGRDFDAITVGMRLFNLAHKLTNGGLDILDENGPTVSLDHFRAAINKPKDDEARAKLEARQAVYEAARAKLPPSPGEDYSEWEGAFKSLQRTALAEAHKEHQRQAKGDLPTALEFLTDEDLEPPRDIVAPYFRDEGITTVFGHGGSGKSTIGAALAVAIGTDAQLTAFARTGEKRPVIVLPYENRQGLKRRLRGFAGGADTSPIRIVPPELMAGPIWEDAYHIRDLIHEAFADWKGPSPILLIDSVSVAIGNLNPSDAEAATQFTKAVEIIGYPAIAIAHQTKSGDTSMPFGSVFWHNGSRMTWHMARDDATGTMTLTCQKDNDGEMRGQRRSLQTVYDEDLAAMPIDVSLADGAGHDTLASQMLTVLATAGDMTAADLAEAIGTDADNIRKTANRHTDLFDKAGKRPTRLRAKVRPRAEAKPQ